MAAIQTIEATASAPIKNTPINTQVGISLPRRSDRFCEYRDDGKFVFPLDCRGYFICDGGKVSFASCPEGEHFHPKLRRCVDEKQSSCFSKMPVQSDMVVTYLPTAKNYKPRDVIKTLHKLWTVNIHLKPRGISTFRGYTSAFYAVAPMEGVFRSVKYRTPSILFESGTTRLQVCGVLNYPSPSTCQTISTPLPLNKFTRVQIQQIPNGADSKFIVKYNRTTMWIGKPTNLRAFHNVLVYHWDNSDSGIRPANAETKRCKFYSGITQGHLIETIKKLYNTWTLQITLLPLGIRDSDSNILHVTQYLNSAREGLLKLDFMDGTSHLRICSPSITSKSSNGCIILFRPLEINKLVTITIQRRQTTKGGYDLVITLTGSQFFSIRFNDAVSRVLEDVNVYVSDSWMPSANAVLDAYQFSTKIK
uniref:Chitin-binding type-2 domain-containing protein n=1 Tax=Clytia hemisphaerica TaxID=252671 RepID=A0A7M5WVJ8_9CNID